MEFSEILQKSREVREAYAAGNEKQWTSAEYMQGFMGDVGDLSKLLMAKNGFRPSKESDPAIAHELADCMWSILIMADELGINLEQTFMDNMNELKEKIQKTKNG
jgi:NTP pyrophosphatase (non-canonical NTP hydrolase)